MAFFIFQQSKVKMKCDVFFMSVKVFKEYAQVYH
jgi:hypothetical protein